MTVIIASWDLTTPGLVGTVDQRSRAALRPSAILGQLRRWWWAVAVLDGRFLDDRADGAKEFKLGRAEHFVNALLGAPSHETATEERTVSGQGAFLVNATSIPSQSQLAFNPRLIYLLGQIARQRGLNSDQWNDPLHEAQPRVAHVPSGCSIELSFSLRPHLPDGYPAKGALAASMADTLVAFGLLGGVGAASRRGFGSMALTSLTCDCLPEDQPAGWGWPSVPCTLEAYKFALVRLVPRPGPRLAAGNAFAAFAEVDLCGAIYLREYPERRASDVFVDFAGMAEDFAAGQGWQRRQASELFSTQAEMHDRRPSPAHFHVHQLADGAALVCSIKPACEPLKDGLPGANNRRNERIEAFLREVQMVQVAPVTAGRAP